MQYKLKKEEAIPFMWENWEVLQMKNFSFEVEVQWNDDESLEQVELALDKAFNNMKNKVSEMSPIFKQKNKQKLCPVPVG